MVACVTVSFVFMYASKVYVAYGAASVSVLLFTVTNILLICKTLNVWKYY